MKILGLRNSQALAHKDVQTLVHIYCLKSLGLRNPKPLNLCSPAVLSVETCSFNTVVLCILVQVSLELNCQQGVKACSDITLVTSFLCRLFSYFCHVVHT